VKRFDENYEGMLFIPSHLRALHISADPLFYPGTLRDNLTIGVAPGDEDGRPERVLEICAMLGLTDRVASLLDTTEQNWSTKFSAAETQLLNLARALVANAEMLCIHKPTAVFNDVLAHTVMKALERYVLERGVFQNPSKIHLRRPRTCVFSAVRRAAVDHANDIIYVDNSGARRIDQEELKHLETDLRPSTGWLQQLTISMQTELEQSMVQPA